MGIDKFRTSLTLALLLLSQQALPQQSASGSQVSLIFRTSASMFESQQPPDFTFQSVAGVQFYLGYGLPYIKEADTSRRRVDDNALDSEYLASPPLNAGTIAAIDFTQENSLAFRAITQKLTNGTPDMLTIGAFGATGDRIIAATRESRDLEGRLFRLPPDIDLRGSRIDLVRLVIKNVQWGFDPNIAVLFRIQGDAEWQFFGTTTPRTATARVTTSNGFITSAEITDNGFGYRERPAVFVQGPGSGASFIANVQEGIVTTMDILNPGSGYWGGSVVHIEPPPQKPRTARATASAVNGFVTELKVTDGGYGYKSVPKVSIAGTGIGASATAELLFGTVNAIMINNPGSGYSETILVTVSPPDSEDSMTSIPLQIAVSRIRLSAPTYPGRHYTLQHSSDITNWETVGSAFLAESNQFVSEVEVKEVRVFYRLLEAQ